jgi:hypothetical protein
MRLGYAAFWEPVPQGTLSGVAWNLRKGIRNIADTVDTGSAIPRLSSEGATGVLVIRGRPPLSEGYVGPLASCLKLPASFTATGP